MGAANRLIVLALSILPVGGVVYTAAQTAPAEPTLLPAGRGAELTQKLCTSCHTVENFIGLRRSASDWNDTVAVMVAYGAPIDASQATVVVRYLGEVFGPDSPPLVDVNRAGRRDLEKLPGLDTVPIEALLTHRERRGDFKSLKQVREILGAGTFERVQGYLILRKPHRP